MRRQPLVRDDTFLGDLINLFALRPVYRKEKQMNRPDRPFSPAHRDDYEAAIERLRQEALRTLEAPGSSDLARVEAHVICDALHFLGRAHEPWTDYDCLCNACLNERGED